MKRLALSILVVSLGFASCEKDKTDTTTTYTGPEKEFQHGKAWTWIEVNNQEKPLRLAIAIDAAAMNSLDNGQSSGEGHHHENTVTLLFPAKASSLTPFNHVGLDWNPQGHEPMFIYGKPHFDFHFYMIDTATRLAIPPFQVDSSKFKIFPSPAYLPANYINPGGGVPQMGVHWLDATSPELNGQPFTQTFLYGSYNGKVTFYEPMITEAFLKSNASFERPIPQPVKYQKNGYYPTKFRIIKSSGITNIILEEFVYRTVS